ncbi:MAG: DUF7345 domain-containing protein [Halobacteriota archaeon]
MRTEIVATCLLVLVVAIALPVGATGGGFGSPAFLQTDDLDADQVILEATVDEHGDAQWAVEYRIDLQDDDTEAAFDSLRADIDANESDYVGPFSDRMNRVVADASAQTGREMTIENPRVTTDRQEIPGPYGIVRYEFEWIGFAAVDGETIAIGDSISGLFLDADSRLVIRYPNGYDVASATPSPDDRTDASVVWNGPVDFGGDEPRVTVAPAGGSVVDADRLAIVTGVLLLSVAGVLWLRRESGLPGLRSIVADSASEPDRSSEAGRSAESDGSTGGDDTGHDPDAVVTDDPEDDADAVPEELLSNEERVIRLLKENGGRMKQQTVVSELGWTDARTSQVVSGLRDANELESFRLGRENVLRLPEFDEGRSDGPDEEQ